MYREQPHLTPLTYAPQAAYRPIENAIGRLKVTIAQAKLSKNYGFTRMDPYCRIRIGHSVYETPTDVNGSKNPRWNKAFSCNLPRGVSSMFIEVFNERYLALDDRIAYAYFEFPDDMFNGETVEEWVTLSGKQGEGLEGNINIILTFAPAPPVTSYQLSAYGGQPVSVVPQTMPAAQVYYRGGYPQPYQAGYPQQQQPGYPQQQPLQPVQQSERGGTTQVSGGLANTCTDTHVHTCTHTHARTHDHARINAYSHSQHVVHKSSSRCHVRFPSLQSCPYYRWLVGFHVCVSTV